MHDCAVNIRRHLDQLQLLPLLLLMSREDRLAVVAKAARDEVEARQRVISGAEPSWSAAEARDRSRRLLLMKGLAQLPDCRDWK